jgi:Ca2+-binding EF-hand superfamily protein
MRKLLLAIMVAAAVAPLLASCAGTSPIAAYRYEHRNRRPPFHPPSEAMEKYDANKDGQVTLAELNAGLKAAYIAADTNHNGIIDVDEMRAVNAARLAANASAATPLIDWNADGHIDFQEFAAAGRALFTQLDRDEDGVLSKTELHPQPFNPRNLPPIQTH